MFHPDGTDEDWSAVMRRESWVIAWPCRPAGAPLLDDLFADLQSGVVEDAEHARRLGPVVDDAERASSFPLSCQPLTPPAAMPST